MKKIVGILYGGSSVEHDISIITALQVYQAIDKEKYMVEMFYITRKNKIIIGENFTDIATYKMQNFKNTEEIFIYQNEDKVFYQGIKRRTKHPKSIDVFLVCVHGAYVEDGTVAGVLSFNKAAYSSPSIKAAALCQDKDITKILLNHYQIPTLYHQVFWQYEKYDINKIPFPCILKPASLGSSIGIITIQNRENFEIGLEKAFKYENKIIVEPYLEKLQEFNCACFKSGEELVISLVEEVTSKNNILTFNDKYQSDKAVRHIPALISNELTDKIKGLTKKIYQLFELSGVVRVDYLYDTESGKLFVNEINTIPGSFAYYLFTKNGISFTKLIDLLIKEALLRKEQTHNYIQNYTSAIFQSQKIISIKK